MLAVKKNVTYLFVLLKKTSKLFYKENATKT